MSSSINSTLKKCISEEFYKTGNNFYNKVIQSYQPNKGNGVKSSFTKRGRHESQNDRESDDVEEDEDEYKEKRSESYSPDRASPTRVMVS